MPPRSGRHGLGEQRSVPQAQHFLERSVGGIGPPPPRPPASAALRKGEKLEVWGALATRVVRVSFQGGSEVGPILAEGRELSRSRGSGREGDSLETGQSLVERRGCVHKTCNGDPSPQAFAGGTCQNSWRHCPAGPPRLSGGQRSGESLCPSADHVSRASSVAACSHPASRTRFNAVAVLTFFFFFFLIYLFIYLFIFGCVGSSLLCEGFLWLWQVGATLHRGARASHYRGLSCCGAQAPDTQAQ